MLFSRGNLEGRRDGESRGRVQMGGTTRKWAVEKKGNALRCNGKY